MHEIAIGTTTAHAVFLQLFAHTLPKVGDWRVLAEQRSTCARHRWSVALDIAVCHETERELTCVEATGHRLQRFLRLFFVFKLDVRIAFEHTNQVTFVLYSVEK